MTSSARRLFTAADLATQRSEPAPELARRRARFVEAGREGTLPPSRLSFNRVRLVWRNDPNTPGGQQSVPPQPMNAAGAGARKSSFVLLAVAMLAIGLDVGVALPTRSPDPPAAEAPA